MSKISFGPPGRESPTGGAFIFVGLLQPHVNDRDERGRHAERDHQRRQDGRTKQKSFDDAPSEAHSTILICARPSTVTHPTVDRTH